MAYGDFLIDPSVTLKGKKPQVHIAPEGHPRRCQAKRHPNWGGGQCRKWALKSRYYCLWHWKKYKRSDMAGASEYIYHKRGTEKLKKLLEQANENKLEDLQGEIDVARVMSAKAVEMVDSVIHSEKEIRESTRLHMMQFVMSTIKMVSEIVEKQVKINALNTMNPEQIEFMNSQIIRILRRYLLPEQEETYVKVVEAFDEIKIPGKEVQITID